MFTSADLDNSRRRRPPSGGPSRHQLLVATTSTEIYERVLVGPLFRPFTEQLVARAALDRGDRVSWARGNRGIKHLACGSSIVEIGSCRLLIWAVYGLARRTGRFPQLVDRRSCVNACYFVHQPRQVSDLAFDDGALPLRGVAAAEIHQLFSRPNGSPKILPTRRRTLGHRAAGHGWVRARRPPSRIARLERHEADCIDGLRAGIGLAKIARGRVRPSPRQTGRPPHARISRGRIDTTAR